MAATSRLLATLLLFCLVLGGVRTQTAWPPPTPGGVEPSTASSVLSRQFLTHEQHRQLTSPSFGRRLTPRPPATARRDWTPIWPAGGEGGAAETSAPRPSVTPSGRPPVTEYYFASAAPPAAEAATFPPAQLPTATFASRTPTRALPASSPRPAATRLGLADRLSALVTSRPARTRIISPTRAAVVPPSSAALRPTTVPAAAAAAPAAAPAADSSSPGLEPSTRLPLVPGQTGPTSAPESTASPAAAAAAAPTALSPTPVSAPCVVTPQGPGGYCRDGDLLTVLTKDPAGNWQAYRTVQLPSSTVAALDGQVDGEGEPDATPDPAGVTPGQQQPPTAQSTPAEDGGATVTSGPQVAETEPTAETVGPLAEPTEAEAAPRPGTTDIRVRPSTPGPTLPTLGPTLPTLPGSGSGDGAEVADEEGAAEATPTATSAVPGPQPPTVGAGAGADEPASTSTPTAPSESEKSGVSPLPSETPEDRQEAGKRTTLQPVDTGTQPATWPPTEAAPQPTARQEPLTTTPGQTPPTTRLPTRPTTREWTPPTTPPPTWPPTESSTRQTSPPTETPSAPATVTAASAAGSSDLPEVTAAPLEPEEAGAGWDPETTTTTTSPEVTWHTLAPGLHPETTLQTSSKNAALGKVSVTDPAPTAASNFSWPSGTSTEDGFRTGTYHFTSGTFDYPSGPTGFTLPTGTHPTEQSALATGTSRFPSTVATTPSDYDYATGPSGGYFGGSGGSHFTYTNNYTTKDGRLTPPPPPPPTDTYSTYGPTDLSTYPTEATDPPSSHRPETTPGHVSTSISGTTSSTSSVATTTSSSTSTSTSSEGPGTSRPPGITHSSVVPPVELYVQFLIGTTWPRFCRMRRAFKQRVVDLVNGDTHSNLTAESVMLFNIPVCGRPVRARREADSSAILVFLYLTDADGHYARQLTERVEPLWEEAAAGGGGDLMTGLVREVDTVRPAPLVQPAEHSERAGVIAAITVGCVAVASIVLLAVLLVVLRHRRRAAQTAQRCNPVSMEEYGVESVFSSMRRKNKLRRSVRSYLNQAFDDHDAPSNTVNFAGLANLSSDLAALKEEFESIPSGAMPTLDDLPAGSEDRNRYANVLPVPETRVVLEQKAGEPNSDYINANYVRGPKEEPQFYIATQGPLESTVNDFWRMIWETQSKVIICLTDIVERGVRRCAEYLPPSEALDRHRLYGDFQVTLMAKAKKDKFVVSTVQLKNMDTNLFREVTHLWYSGWPERGVPSDLDSLVEFLLEARRAMKTNIGPTVVHCSPGTGRTGVLLACDICVRQFEASRTADIMRTVFRIRQDRAGAVQTREQYALIYKVLNQYAASVTSGNLPALE